MGSKVPPGIGIKGWVGGIKSSKVALDEKVRVRAIIDAEKFIVAFCALGELGVPHLTEAVGESGRLASPAARPTSTFGALGEFSLGENGRVASRSCARAPGSGVSGLRWVVRRKNIPCVY